MAQNRISKRSVAVVSLFLIVALGVFVLQPAIAHAYDTCLPMNQLGEKPDGDPDTPGDFVGKTTQPTRLDVLTGLRIVLDVFVGTEAIR